MKTVTLIAVIAIILEIIPEIYYLLTNYGVLGYSSEIGKILQPLFLFSSLGLLVFFIQLYQKQSK